MLGPINITTFDREPVDRTPYFDARTDLDELKGFAGSLGYAETCEIYVRLKALTVTRPRDLANSPVLHAWMDVLAIEASLLEFSRAHDIAEGTTYRFFVTMRGKGIPRKPAWQMALRRAQMACA